MKLNQGRWLLPTAIVFQLASFLIFALVTLQSDPLALKSSIYTYYQSRYYVHLSAGELPWIQFDVEYPPLTVFCLLFPAYVPGLSVLVVSLLRAAASTLITSLVLVRVIRSGEVDDRVKIGVVGATSLIACVLPGFYHGLFDWTMYLSHLLLALSLITLGGTQTSSKATWWIVWLGTSIKLLPLLAAPFLAIGLPKELRRRALLPLGIVAMVHVPFIVWGFQGLRYFVAFHRMRGIDCFSIYSTALLTAERIGLVTVSAVDKFGALEVVGPMSTMVAKLSLPLFLVVLAFLWLHARKLPTLNQRLGMYFVAILLYPVISKVSQSNYVVWSVSSIVALWLLGFSSKQFFAKTGVVVVLLIVVGWAQNAWFDGYLLKEAPWVLLVTAWLRFVLLIGVSVLAIREIGRPVSTATTTVIT